MSSNVDYLDVLKKTQLSKICRLKGLSTVGNKADLIARIRRNDIGQITPFEEQTTNVGGASTSTSEQSIDREDQEASTRQLNTTLLDVERRHMNHHEMKVREMELELEILRHKKELRELESESHNASATRDNHIERLIDIQSLPRPKPPVFSGEPLEFFKWEAAFDTLVHKRSIPDEEKIYFLQSYVAGKAAKSIDGLFTIGTAHSYVKARQILKEKFGNQFRVGNAFIVKLNEWKPIKSNDPEELDNFSDFLNQCKEAMTNFPRLTSKLNDCEVILQLARKLPDCLKSKWSSKGNKYKEIHEDYPPFSEFAKFVAQESDRAQDPILSMNALQEKSTLKPTGISATKEKKVSPQFKKVVTHVAGALAEFEHKLHCDFCLLNNHNIVDCYSLAKQPYSFKRQYIYEHRLCFGCLKAGHLSTSCSEKAQCKKCNMFHPTCMHFDPQKQFPKEDKTDSNQNKKNLPQQDTKEYMTVQPYLENNAKVGGQNSTQQKTVKTKEVRALYSNQLCFPSKGQTTMIVPVYLSTKERPQKETLIYALLDSQSDTTFVLDDIVSHNMCEGSRTKLAISTMTSKNEVSYCTKYSALQVRGFWSDKYVDISEAYSTKRIPVNRSNIPTQYTASSWKHLSHLSDRLAPLQDCPIGLLIGFNCPEASAPVSSIRGEQGEPYAVETALGWSIVGGGDASSVSSETAMSLFYTHRIKSKELPTNEEILKSLEDNLYEQKGTSAKVSLNDIKFLNIMEENIRMENGFYTMPLPFTTAPDKPKVPNNRIVAVKRLTQLKRRFKDAQFFDKYQDFMKTMFQNGEAVPVPPSELDKPNVWYIPHHGVINPMKPGKVRVVFDCSSKYEGKCLNDYLLDGPDLTNNLVGILHRFRQYKIAFTADVERMFYRFRVPTDDQDFLRFVWFKEGSLDEVRDYKMTVHIFGASSSPGCANYGFKQLAKDNEKDYPKAAQFIHNNFYVDDGLKSVATVEEAIDIISQSRDLCVKGNVRLHKFISNSVEVLASIPDSEVAIDKVEPLPTLRTLGIRWNLEQDVFTFENSIKKNPNTRRGILSTVSSLYDPLGFLAPYTLVGKRILQGICRQEKDWDGDLDPSSLEKWFSWSNDLKFLSSVKIPRCFQHPVFCGTIERVELHNFSDASLEGVGQCSYIRIIDIKGNISVNLIKSKSKVPPKNVLTIPRMELVAAVLSVKVCTSIMEELEFEDIECHFWTDSQVVLGYIQNDAKQFHTFVSNRVQKIRSGSHLNQWHYIKSADNPADKVSRGMTLQALVNDSEWFEGPEFLHKDIVFPSFKPPSISLEDPEVKKVSVYSTSASAPLDIVDRLEKFSSWQAVVSAISKLIWLAKCKPDQQSELVLIRQKAKSLIIQQTQARYFGDEIESLKNDSLVPKGSPIQKLEPYVDDEGILRIGGRLRNSSYDTQFKHPVILPKTGHVTLLLIKHYHCVVAHQGKVTTLGKIRTEGYYIIGGTRLVSSIIHKCVQCRKIRGSVTNQKMSDLPSVRSEEYPPFTNVGCDCFGPFVVKEGRKEMKKYGVVFTCLVSRGVHIEILDDMSTDSFINALRCFVSLRGPIKLLMSDQGTNFVGANNEFKEAMKELDTDQLQEYLRRKEVQFKFNTPTASHMGGVWERMIRTIRNVMKGLAADAAGRLDTSGLRTLFYEVMAIINSRPITTVSINDPSMEPLTPNHLLTLKTSSALPPPGVFDAQDIYSRKRWRKVQGLSEMFWKRWKTEYLSQIKVQNRQKWKGVRRNLKVGDVVYLEEKNDIRSRWRLAKVEIVHPSSDGLIRSVTLRVCNENNSTSCLQRPATACVVLLEA